MKRINVHKQHRPTGKLRGGCTGRGFLPGQSGNPGGRRKSAASLTAVLKRLLSQSDAETIVRRLIGMAKAGSIRAMELLLNRLDGPLAGPLAITMAQAVTVENRNDLSALMANVPTSALVARIQRDFEEMGEPMPPLIGREGENAAQPPVPPSLLDRQPERAVEPQPDDPPAPRGVLTATEFLK